MEKQVKLTEEQALKLLSGRDFWQSEALGELGIPAIRMSDGPHGLRYQSTEGDHLGINESAKATAFPTASASASSWNPVLLRKMGEAIGNEARSLDVDIVLGPGANIKRNPLGGRNFEYFSEDPYLAGEMAAAWIEGLQSTGTGASLKHFAGNNQETDRLLSDSLIDEVALHELYLEVFRIAVTKAQPETIMNAYNRVNGTYMSENRLLLTQILRQQWGFGGAVVTDWGAMNDPVKSLNAGTDLEMPGNEHFFLPALKAGLKSGDLDASRLQEADDKIIALAQKKRPEFTGDRAALLKKNAALSQQIAEESAVLLQNNNHTLPLSAGKRVVLIGEMARQTRYQGAGSSHINPINSVSIEDGLRAAGMNVTYETGYTLTEEEAPQLFKAAVTAAQSDAQVVVVVGLPDRTESEGFDRDNLKLPANQNELVEALAKENPNLVVLVVAGASVEMPWQDRVDAIMTLYLGGQQVGAATARLLLGQVNPSGHLAESFPIQYADVPSSDLFGKNPRSVPYVESLYVGYRYYDKAAQPVLFPFGHGLSYTNFSYDDITVDRTQIASDDDQVSVHLTVTNTGKVDGATVVQVYVGDTDQVRLTPQKALKAFIKVALKAGEKRLVTISLPAQAFKHWQTKEAAWLLEEAAHQVYVGTSSQKILAQFSVQTTGISPVHETVPAWYQQPTGKPTVTDFEILSGLHVAPIPVPKPRRLTAMNTPRELSQFSKVVARVTRVMLDQQLKQAGDEPGSPEAAFLETIILDTPLIRLAQQSSGALKMWQVQFLVGLANQPVRHLFSAKRRAK